MFDKPKVDKYLKTDKSVFKINQFFNFELFNTLIINLIIFY